jgi:hypothetical protein
MREGKGTKLWSSGQVASPHIISPSYMSDYIKILQCVANDQPNAKMLAKVIVDKRLH